MTKLSVHQRKARDFIQREDWSNALVELERMLGVDVGNPTLHNQIGDVYLRKDDVAQAVEQFGRFGGLDQRHSSAGSRANPARTDDAIATTGSCSMVR